jgi:glutaryl-CoA dehydrogenase
MSLRGPLSCLNEARFGIVWGAVGAARACLESALGYACTRVQFGKPIASFQLVQRKLADMALEVNRATPWWHMRAQPTSTRSFWAKR